MSRLATIAFGAAIALSPALIYGQGNGQTSPTATSPTTGANTTGTSNAGATTPAPTVAPAESTPAQTVAPTQSTTPQSDVPAQTAAPAQSTTPQSELPAQTAAPAQTTTPRSDVPVQPDSGVTSGRSTAREAMDSTGSADRAMPNTAAGWLAMMFSGSMLSGAGLALRRFRK